MRADDECDSSPDTFKMSWYGSLEVLIVGFMSSKLSCTVILCLNHNQEIKYIMSRILYTFMYAID